MSEFEITYEITPDDYVHANNLLYKGQKQFRFWSNFTSIMACMVLLVAWQYYERYGREDILWLLLLVPAGFLLYMWLLWRFPGMNSRRNYDPRLSGQQYTARFSSDQIAVKGSIKQWIHRWPAFDIITESPQMFLFFDGAILFIFSKRFFTAEQITALQALIKEYRSKAQG